MIKVALVCIWIGSNHYFKARCADCGFRVLCLKTKYTCPVKPDGFSLNLPKMNLQKALII